MEYDPLFKGFTDVMVTYIGKECMEVKNRRHHLLTMLCTLPGVFIPSNTINIFSSTLLSKAIPLEALTGPEGSRLLRLPDFNP
jgi:hypothetical protein